MKELYKITIENIVDQNLVMQNKAVPKLTMLTVYSDNAEMRGIIRGIEQLYGKGQSNNVGDENKKQKDTGAERENKGI